MKARYPGHCNRCDDPIRKGEEVVLRRVLGLMSMIHVRCASGQED